jgi:hypothetical protein
MGIIELCLIPPVVILAIVLWLSAEADGKTGAHH